MKYRSALLLLFVIILIDQVVKVYVKTHFHNQEEVMVAGNWFRLHFLENKGMAFGMELSESPTGKFLLTFFRLIAVVAGFFILKNLVRKGYSRGLIICGSLILAGALGNLIDSLFYGLIFTSSDFHLASLVAPGHGYGTLFHGRVVDMLYFPLYDGTWPKWVPKLGGHPFQFFEPVFNIADASISVGVIALVIFQKRLLRRNEVQQPEFKATEQAELGHS